jgi:excisionase family DNA binding protein
MSATVHAKIQALRTKPRLFSIKEVVFELGISRTSLYELIKGGKLETIKIGRRRLVPTEAIERLIAGLER